MVTSRVASAINRVATNRVASADQVVALAISREDLVVSKEALEVSNLASVRRKEAVLVEAVLKLARP